MVVRTRFAPSPTGVLHVGSVRTALFSWLYAKHHKGQFILRIEDTDQMRSTPESVQAILDGMAWLGLDYEEGPIYQTDRYERYQTVVESLLTQKKAYRCVCTKERLEAMREQQIQDKQKPRYDGHCRQLDLPAGDQPFVIRFKNPEEGIVAFQDQVYGEILIDNRELDDLVLMRSDGHPTYNFAVVVDDWDMRITHVIRGDDHINNTPKQINLFQALEAPIPQFAHLPMILGKDGKKLSKRHGAVNVMEFKSEGYLPQALLNYLVRLGWSAGDQEIFTHDEMISKFDFRHVHRGAAAFDYDKLVWINQHYMRHTPIEQMEKILVQQYALDGVDVKNGPDLSDVIPVFAERCKTIAEFCDSTRYFYQELITYDAAAVSKHLHPEALQLLDAFCQELSSLVDWDKASIHACIETFCAARNMNMGKIAQPLRVAVTGSTSSPSIDITLVLLGRDRTLARLQTAIKK